MWEMEKAEKAERAEKALKSSKNRPDVGKKDDLAKPILERRDSDAASEITMINPGQEIKKVDRRVIMDENIRIEDDRCSIYSIDSMDERYVNMILYLLLK